jgi:RimJ/RimL family protein N-acetyltransferase
MLRGKLVNLVEPSRIDHELVRSIWEDQETMAEVGGIAPLTEEKYKEWWLYMFDEKADENQYFLVLDTDNCECFGEVSFHRFDKVTRRAMFNIKIHTKFRGRGYAKEAIDLMLEHFFDVWKGEVMEDSVREQNRRGLEYMKEYGFRERGRDKDEVLLEMRREDWVKTRKAAV